MVQDVARWKNQNFACTIYDMSKSGHSIVSGFIVEAINVDKPIERAYCYLPTLEGMRGEDLEEYLDSELKIEGPKKKRGKKNIIDSEQAGAAEIIEKISFETTPAEFV